VRESRTRANSKADSADLGSGAGLAHPQKTKSQHHTPRSGLKPKGQEEQGQALQQMQATHWGRDEGARYQLDRTSKISPEQGALARCRGCLCSSKCYRPISKLVIRTCLVINELSTQCLEASILYSFTSSGHNTIKASFLRLKEKKLTKTRIFFDICIKCFSNDMHLAHICEHFRLQTKCLRHYHF
jgi:hypothetical protein